MNSPLPASLPAPPDSSRQLLTTVAKLLRPWLTLALVCALFSLAPRFRGTFWTPAYLPNVLQQSARNIVLAVGMSFVILTGGIDLSVGAVLALSGVALALGMAGTLPAWLSFTAALPVASLLTRLIAARIKSKFSAPPIALTVTLWILLELGIGAAIAKGAAGGVKMEGAILLALLIGAGCGLVNGAVIAVGRVPAFVMTLGMLSAARGLTLYATGGSSVPAAVPRFLALGEGIPLAAIVLVVVVCGVAFLNTTRAGRYILSIGGSETASRLSGVPVVPMKTLAYVLAGLCAAIGAVLVTAKFGSADTNAGLGAELDAIAAVVIGGASLSGGQGSIVGALVGALTITVIENGLVLVGVTSEMQPVILGIVIVAAVFLDQIRKNR